jgi:hypothetical protein
MIGPHIYRRDCGRYGFGMVESTAPAAWQGEHSNPELEKSALGDQIEDLIYANVKEERLQKSEKRWKVTT